MARRTSWSAALVLPWALGGALAAFTPEPSEKVFLDLLDKDHHPLEAREAARRYLAGRPESFLACEVIGMVYLRSEGDLPKALYYFTRARTLLEARYRHAWTNDSPRGYYGAILNFLYQTQYRMERYEDALATLKTREQVFFQQEPSLKAWPLMKLGRFPEARRRIEETLAAGDPRELAGALNTLGALEAEADQPEAAFATSLRASSLEPAKGMPPDPTLARNAATNALNLGLLARAEQLFLAASDRFSASSVSNPWGDLTALYLAEQRFPEAMDALKRMHLWAFHTRPLMAETHWNTRQILTGGLLMYCGCTEEALTIARHLAERPDREATGSARKGQKEAGAQLFLYQVLQDALARDEEDFSCAPWKHRPALLVRRARHLLEAALARRRAGSLLLGTQDRLDHALRCLAVQAIVTIPGGEALLPRLAGSGVAEAELLRLLARTGPTADRERGFVLFGLGAARLARNDTRGALEALAWAETLLPAEFALLRTQLLALRAKALLARGDAAGALPALTSVLQRDGGEVRRMGLALPCRIEAAGPLASQAAALLQASPRLAPGRWGFRLMVASRAGGGLQGWLESPQGEVLSRFQVPPGADGEATARAFCRQFHRSAFGPRVDLSQQQIRSLEGSTLAARSAEEELKGLFSPGAPPQP